MQFKFHRRMLILGIQL